MHALPSSLDPAALNAGVLQVLQTAGVLVTLKAADNGCYLWVNEPFAAFVGRPVDEVLGRSDLELLSQADAQAVRAGDQRAVGAGVPAAGEHRFERGETKLDFHTLRCLVAATDGSLQVLSLWWDQSERRQEARQLQAALEQLERQQAAIEQLSRQQRDGADRPTEVFRREQFEEHLRRELALSSREHREFALVLLALDQPDVLRAASGEAAVQQVAATIGHLLRSNTRAMDVISLLDGQRHAVLLSGVGLATAHTRMEQIRRQCATHLVVHGGQPLSFSVSVGVASFPHTADTLEALSIAAERALQVATSRGGNRVVLATISLSQAAAAPPPSVE